MESKHIWMAMHSDRPLQGKPRGEHGGSKRLQAGIPGDCE